MTMNCCGSNIQLLCTIGVGSIDKNFGQQLLFFVDNVVTATEVVNRGIVPAGECTISLELTRSQDLTPQLSSFEANMAESCHNDVWTCHFICLLSANKKTFKNVNDNKLISNVHFPPSYTLWLWSSCQNKHQTVLSDGEIIEKQSIIFWPFL